MRIGHSRHYLSEPITRTVSPLMFCFILMLVASAIPLDAFSQQSGSQPSIMETMRNTMKFQRAERNAKTGDAAAQHKLGNYYLNGIGTEKNLTEGFRWALKSAEQGYAPAMVSVGKHLFYGWGVAEDHAEAMQWMNKADETGEADASFHIAMAYLSGTGVEKSDTEAVRWLKKGAEAGSKYAQHRLARRYRLGRGVEKDEEQAFKLYLSSASQGYYPASLNVGYAYRHGIGTAADLKLSIRWYENAMIGGVEKATNRLAWLLATSTDDEIRDGQRAVRMMQRFLQRAEESPEYLDTLAASYAEAGDFDSAVSMQQKAITLLSPQKNAQQQRLQKRLESYLKKQAWRE